MATKVGRSLDEINKKTKELNSNVKSLTNQNKLLDKSLKFEKNPFEILTKRAENTKEAISSLTEKISLLKKQQEEYAYKLERGEITQNTYDKLANDIVKAELQLKQLNAELLETNKTLNLLPAQKFTELGSKIENIGSKLKVVSVGATGALVALTGIGLSANKSIDDLDTLAKKLGVTAEELQYLEYIALKTDVEFTKMQNAFVKVKNALGSQLVGETNSAVQALNNLGISAGNFDNNLEAFYAIADALGKIKDSAIQSNLASDLFGENIGTEMVNFLNAGQEALKSYEKELANIGIISNEAVESVSGFNDSIDRIKQSFSLVKNELGLALLPIMEQIASFLENKFIPFIDLIVKKFAGWNTSTKSLLFVLMGITAVLSPLLIVIGKIVGSIGSLITLLPKLNTLFNQLSGHQIFSVISLIATLLAVLYVNNEKFRESVNKLFNVLSTALTPMLSLVVNLFSDIIQIITPLIDAISGPLALAFNFLATILQTVADLIALIVDGLKWVLDKVGVVFGKGWLWGKDGNLENTEMILPSYTTYQSTTANTATTSNITNSINIDSIVIEKNEYTNTDELLEAISKKLAIKVQARS